VALHRGGTIADAVGAGWNLAGDGTRAAVERVQLHNPAGDTAQATAANPSNGVDVSAPVLYAEFIEKAPLLRIYPLLLTSALWFLPDVVQQETAATSLFLATKVEENMRKFGEIVVACVRAAQKNLHMEVHRDDKEFWRWKDCILSKEEYLLESICFDVSVEVPYNHLLNYTSQLGVQTRQLIRTAWTFLNDATLTMLCILYPPRTIAAAALYCAAKHHNIEFPDQDGKPWWEVIGVRVKDIKKCCNYMALVYEYAPLSGQH
jgi:hypothetical protein